MRAAVTSGTPAIFCTYFMPLTFERHVPFRVLGRRMHCPLRRRARSDGREGGVFVIHIVSLIPLDACRISLVRTQKARRLRSFDL